MRRKRGSSGTRERGVATIAAMCLLVLIAAGSAAGQTDARTLDLPDRARAETMPVVADSLLAEAVAGNGAATDSLVALADSLLAAPPDSLPDPVAELMTGPDLWDTGASPAAAVLMSPLFPGWGQLYTENSWRAALAYGSQMWFWSRMLTRDRRAVRAREFAVTFEEGEYGRTAYDAIAEENWEQMRDFAWWSGAAMLIIALDSYVGAHLFHFDDDPVPVPNRWDDMFGPTGDPPGGPMPGSTDAPSVVVARWGTRF